MKKKKKKKKETIESFILCSPVKLLNLKKQRDEQV